MSSDSTALRTFPSRIADLGFRVQLPAEWISHTLPDEDADFSNPSFCYPLAIVTAPHSVVVFAVGARPAYEDGTLSDWARYLAGESGLQLRAMGAGAMGTMPAIMGEAVQDSDLGPMVVRFAFCEDGQRLLNITFTAPEQLDSAVRGVWFKAVESFTLETPRGTTVALHPAPEPPQPAPEPEPEPEPAARAAEPERRRKASSRERRNAAMAAAQADAVPPGDTPGELPADEHYDEQSWVEGAQPIRVENWWEKAVELEKSGAFEAAEKMITDNVRELGALASVAEMYRLRAVRLRNEGDIAGSQAAAKKAEDWIYSYAGGATSGGEGAALSLQRDEFIASMRDLLPKAQ